VPGAFQRIRGCAKRGIGSARVSGNGRLLAARPGAAVTPAF
jgi:hypothetical protein